MNPAQTISSTLAKDGMAVALGSTPAPGVLADAPSASRAALNNGAAVLPKRALSIRHAQSLQPRWGWDNLMRLPQGSSFLATLGWWTQSRWDWNAI